MIPGGSEGATILETILHAAKVFKNLLFNNYCQRKSSSNLHKKLSHIVENQDFKIMGWGSWGHNGETIFECVFKGKII
jgi:hypothetical protein